MKKYRLLRDNKETGPHTADELIKLGFKKYDLIWAEGKSAAWRYPGELEEFKLHAPVIEEQPYDRFYKRPSALVKVSSETAVLEKGALTAIVIEKKEKPRIRIKADSHKIETTAAPVCIAAQPKELVPPKPQPQTTAKATPEWKEVWLDWEQEKKAVAQLPPEPKEEPVLETKYALSIDEIKERYAETVLKPKNNKFSLNNNHITAIVLIVAILATGIWLGVKWSGDSNVAATQVKEKIQEPVAENTLLQDDKPATNSVEPSALNETVKQDNASKNNEAIVSTVATKTIAPKKTITPDTKKLAANKIVSATQQAAIKPYEKKSKALVKTAPNSAVIIAKPETKPGVQNNPPAVEITDASKKYRKAAQEPAIKDYIAVDAYTPSPASTEGIKYRVQNISNTSVDLVMIDLQYYDATGHYIKGETVYARNLSSGESVTIPAPQNATAAKVNYKVSMVSSEANNLYLIAD